MRGIGRSREDTSRRSPRPPRPRTPASSPTRAPGPAPRERSDGHGARTGPRRAAIARTRVVNSHRTMRAVTEP